jgi:hypothetical protein
MPIQLVSEDMWDSSLRPGDRGTVEAIRDDGAVTVLWEHGLFTELDPSTTSFRTFD